MNEEKMYYKHIHQITMSAILEEVSLSKKPGLVEPDNPGAHKDMDYETFLKSTKAIDHYMYQMCKVSADFQGHPKDLFKSLQRIGLEAEADMFKATDGINTHKGMIFNMGLLASATIQVKKTEEDITLQAISNYIQSMTQGLSKTLGLGKSYGDQIYREYGIKGVRGDAEAGYPILFEHLMPKLIELRPHYTDDRLYNHMLLHAMVVTTDTNIIARHDLETLKEVQEMAKQFLSRYPIMNDHALGSLSKLNAIFVNLNISPGGSADLLAMIIFLDKVLI